MGTRSLTVVKDNFWGKNEEVMVMYRQFDGYPEGHGDQLVDFLLSGEGVNGIPVGSDKLFFNGAGCLAASLVSHFKNGAGGIYLEPSGSRNCGEEYIYEVTVNADSTLLLKVYSVYAASTPIFEGTPETWNASEAEKVERALYGEDEEY